MANEFNFSRAPFVNERLPRTVFALALTAVAAATVLHGVLLTRYLMREQESLDVRVDELRQELSETNTRMSQAESSLARNRTELGSVQTQFLTTLFRRKSFSWTGLFNELEEISPPSVRITSIAPTEKEGEISVTMTVVGRTLQDVLEMVRALESSSLKSPVQEKLFRRKRVVRNWVCTLPSSVRFRASAISALDFRAFVSASSWRSSLTRMSSDSCSRRR